MTPPHGSLLYEGKAKRVFETDHPEFGKTFQPKHFRFMEPGIVQRGHDFDQFKILVLDEENPFDENASSHPFNDD